MNAPSHKAAFVIDVSVVVAATGAGLLCPWGVARWYGALLTGFIGIAGAVLTGALVVHVLTGLVDPRKASRTATPARDARARRARHGAGRLIAACLLAWPVARMWAGLPTGLVFDVDAAGGPLRVAISNVLAIVALDAWLYWKHRLLHTRALFPFHRAHHAYRDPTSLASFAVGPVESVLTFWPVVLVAHPAAPHYAPVYFALVVGFISLNFYLHCGVGAHLIEATLPRLGFNTSAFHNRHHANANVNFGEAMIVWDRLMRTEERAACDDSRAHA
ncbi:MAG: sterol desaturase family protein [Polyangiaceae bacterium]